MAKKTNKKAKQVDELVAFVKGNRSVIIASIKNLPAANFQEIRKKIRDKATIKVYKKNIILKAIEKIEKGFIKEMKNYVVEDSALIFTKIDPF